LEKFVDGDALAADEELAGGVVEFVEDGNAWEKIFHGF
jgi:hypothetical protein